MLPCSNCRRKVKVIEAVTGKGLKDIIEEKGILRQMGMELFCRAGGLKGPEAGVQIPLKAAVDSGGRKHPAGY